MELAKSQDQILHRLKTRGPQSVKILSNQLDMTTMGVRQHLAELEQKGLVSQTREEKQTRGRPVHLWRLTQPGHQRFPDGHSQVTLELIDVIRKDLGEASLNRLIDSRNDQVTQQYRQEIAALGDDIQAKVQKLAELRSIEGYMAEVRLLPDGWLLIENHCPICAAADKCQQFCRAELKCFQDLFAEVAIVERIDHMLAGARRCAYKVSPTSQ
ncbi:MAG: transcriptional regulator [Gammaproteobacteria bacterium]|nr:transcriptional regulator [Gammaproteobacteria bacterium]MDD9896448.1 transcriptional regulator [Gammaproteobacteria bacterium]MDD9958524.1 transcriptional regulator [Gammaproteobacteria bacterium]